jgi:hypothetical protein
MSQYNTQNPVTKRCILQITKQLKFFLLVAGSCKCKLPQCMMDIRICLMRELPVRFYAYSMIGVANHVSDWSTPNFRRIRFVVLDSTVVRDDQAFWP